MSTRVRLNTKRNWIILCIAGMAVFGLGQWLFAHPHGEELWHKFPITYSVIGVLGCLLIVFVSKRLGKAWLQRPEDYYADAEESASAGAQSPAETSGAGDG